MTERRPGQEPVFERRGDFIVFNQLGIKLELDTALPMERYFGWLDEMTVRIGDLVRGARIVEKEYARTAPRVNTGVYYDTRDRILVTRGAVLRTTCNKITHAFCAYKEAVDDRGVRRDHRHVFDGEEKRSLQEDPLSDESVAIVRRLLARDDLEQPGRYLQEREGIEPAELSPSIRVVQERHPFFVWLDRRDALRCVMDRALVSDLRAAPGGGSDARFHELEVPVYPRIDPEVARDPRTARLIEVLAASAEDELGAVPISLNKYQRAARVLGIVGA